MNFTIKPDFKVCGKLLGSGVQQLNTYLMNCDTTKFMSELTKSNEVKVQIEGKEISLTKDMLDIRINAKEGFDVQMQDNLFIILDTKLTKELTDEGFAREIISKVQQMRKAADYEVADRIKLYINGDEQISSAIKAYDAFIKKETLTTHLYFGENDGENVSINGHETKIKTEKI